MLSISGHKMYAPKGVGALYVRGGTRVQQLMYGGHHQRGYRPGTENVAAIVGLGKASEIARKSLSVDAERVEILRDELERGLLHRVTDARVNGAGSSAHAEHDEHHVCRDRWRGAGDCVGFEGTGLLDGRGVFVGSS